MIQANSTRASAPVIFDLLPSKRRADRFSLDPQTGGARQLHIRRLFDLLHLLDLRRDRTRAQRIWAVLVRCREVDFRSLWDLGLRMLDLPHLNSEDDDRSVDEKRLAYLKACQNLSEEESSRVLIEYICSLIAVGQTKDALDEVELYLPIHPHSQHAGLHEYAGMIALSLAQPSSDHEVIPSEQPDIIDYFRSIAAAPYFGKAKVYFERAQLLGSSSTMLSDGYLQLMMTASQVPP